MFPIKTVYRETILRILRKTGGRRISPVRTPAWSLSTLIGRFIISLFPSSTYRKGRPWNRQLCEKPMPNVSLPTSFVGRNRWGRREDDCLIWENLVPSRYVDHGKWGDWAKTEQQENRISSVSWGRRAAQNSRDPRLEGHQCAWATGIWKLAPGPW